MASLELRGKVWHLLWRWRGRQKSRTTKISHDGKFKNGIPVPPVAVKRELRKLENSLDQGRNYETKTLSQLLDLVEKDYAVSGFKSFASLKSRLEHIRDWFGNLRADRIENTDFTEYADFRKKKSPTNKTIAANKTVMLELEVLRKALKLGKLPVPDMPKLVLPAPRQGFFDDAKIAAVCRHLPEYLRAPVMFGYYTGWRREEVFGLQWKDVSFTDAEIRLWDSKNRTARVFPMDAVPGLRGLLEAIAPAKGAVAIAPAEKNAVVAREVPTVTPWVFIRKIKKTGKVRRIVDFRKALETACVKAGCPGMLFHDLRRSAARNLELAGWPRTLITQWMGHETEAMFHRYRIVSAADREIVSDRLAKVKKAGASG